MSAYLLNTSPEGALSTVQAAGIAEYGLGGGMLADRLRAVQEPHALIAALNNGDTEGVLLQLLDTEVEQVFVGMKAAAQAAGTEECVLYLPEYAEDRAKGLAVQARKYGIEVDCGFLNVREHRNDVIVHMVTMVKLAYALAGAPDDSVYLSVDGAPLTKVSPSQTLAELTGEADVKAVFSGVRLLGTEAIHTPVGELPIENGSVRLLRGKDCAVQETARAVKAFQGRSCGRCVFCREGLIQLSHMLGEVSSAKGKTEYLDLLAEIGEAMCDSTICTLGQNAAKSVLSLLEVCGGETEAHIKKKECPAGACAAFTHIYIDPQLCTGCEDCADICPKDCIEGKRGYIHMIDEFDCDKCGKCADACEERAVILTSGKLPKLPDRLTKVGRFRK